MAIDVSMTMRQGRTRYLKVGGLPADGGYDDDWVRISIFGLPVVFPNTVGRKRAIPLHDLHHVVTGYETTYVGEAEIGAWEIASGCSGAALVLNLAVMGFGWLGSPARVFSAFRSGRNCQNLYFRPVDDDLLARSVGEMRNEIGLERPLPRTTAGTTLSFLGWTLASFGVAGAPIWIGAALAAALL